MPATQLEKGDAIIDAPPASARVRTGIRRALRFASNPLIYWAVFPVVHLVVGLMGYYGGGFGDVLWYRTQIRTALVTGVWPVIDTSFVYPGGALPVILLPYVFGSRLYVPMWMVMVTVLNALAVLSLLRWNPWDRRRLWLAWWWLAFILLLGPVALGRVDSVSVPVAILAFTWLWRRPAVSGAVLAFAGWVKIWPVAVFAALFVVLRRRWRLLLGAIVGSAIVVGVYLALGATPTTVFSFITEQNDRSIQAEAVFATPWLWIGAIGGPAGIVWNRQLLTNEIYGVGSGAMADLLTPLMALAALLLCALGWWARRRGARVREVIPPLMLGLVAALIVFNKVGSPQFMSWLAVPIIIGLALQRRRFEAPARFGLVLALLTQIVFPTLYLLFLWLNPALLVIITLRNGLLVYLLGWSVHRLVACLRSEEAAPQPDDAHHTLPTGTESERVATAPDLV